MKAAVKALRLHARDQRRHAGLQHRRDLAAQGIESVRAQIYPHWELCLVNDGSTTPHVQDDPRRVRRRSSRGCGWSISPATRASRAPRATGSTWPRGDFVALLDHDDELPPEALFEVVKRARTRIRTSTSSTPTRTSSSPDGRRVEPFFKPDWSPDLLLSMNYITHLSVFRRSLLAEIGGFRLGLDGSQDYDLLLRFTERTERIAHIPKILYHWRKIPGSAAASRAAKPFAYEAGRQAIEDAREAPGLRGARSRCSGRALLGPLQAARESPLVSIIIPTRDRWSLLQQCLRSIEERTTLPALRDHRPRQRQHGAGDAQGAQRDCRQVAASIRARDRSTSPPSTTSAPPRRAATTSCSSTTTPR